MTVAAYLKQHYPHIAQAYAPDALQGLSDAYDEPHRDYHGPSHVIDLLEQLKPLAHLAERPDLIAHAICWHDIVYRTHENGVRRLDALNVEDSANWFERESIAFSHDDRLRVSGMIRATSGHAPRVPKSHPDYSDTALFLDLDLSVLAQPYAEFQASTARIRSEYSYVDDALFAAGRATFLETYVTKDELFLHPVTAARFDGPARDNMRRQAAEFRKQLQSLVTQPRKLTP
jgi:predicted metal-dependent HD superfamily phosphohydrolase